MSRLYYFSEGVYLNPDHIVSIVRWGRNGGQPRHYAVKTIDNNERTFYEFDSNGNPTMGWKNTSLYLEKMKMHLPEV